jgi:hypothetical protein
MRRTLNFVVALTLLVALMGPWTAQAEECDMVFASGTVNDANCDSGHAFFSMFFCIGQETGHAYGPFDVYYGCTLIAE